MPVGAVSAFSASYAEALNDYAGPEVEAMRLSGDVRIDVIGTGKPIEIKADRVVLELTADEVAGRKASLPLTGSRQFRSGSVIEDGARLADIRGRRGVHAADRIGRPADQGEPASSTPSA